MRTASKWEELGLLCAQTVYTMPIVGALYEEQRL